MQLNRKFVFFAICSLFVILHLATMLRAYYSYCFNASDLGIYAQAIAKISLSDLNPFIPNRDVQIFFDHFDPIIAFPAFLRFGADPALLVILIEAFSVIFGSFAFLYLYRKRMISFSWFVAALGVYFFGYALFRALHHPGHPSNWSLLPLMWFAAFLRCKEWRRAFLCYSVMLLYKEEYAIYGFILALFFAREKETRAFGLTLLVACAIWSIGVFVVRPQLANAYIGYEQTLQKNIMTLNQFAMFYGSKSTLKSLLMFFLPIVPLFWVKQKFSKEQKLLLGICAAMVATRFVGMWWFPHRSVQVAALSLMALVPSQKSARQDRLAYVVFAVLAVLGIVPFAQGFSRAYLKGAYRNYCSNDSRRIESIENAFKILDGVKDKKVFIQGNLNPNYLVRNDDIAILGGNVFYKSLKNNVIVLHEKSPSGDPFPYEFIDEHAICSIDQVIFENDYVKLVECRGTNNAPR